jgi:Gram-negative bacterial TonB protein C-terminal
MKLQFGKSILGVFIAAIVAQMVVSAPPEPLRLKPTSKWISDYQPDGCRLMRQFGEGEVKSLIVMSRFAPTDYFQLTLAGKPFKSDAGGKVTLQFGSAEAEQAMDFFPGNFGEMPAIVMATAMRIAPITKDEMKAREKLKPTMYSSLAPVGSEREKAVTFVKVAKPFRKPVVLELGKMDKPFAALSTCISDLVKSWGVDPESHKTLTRFATPKNNPGSWVTPADYPYKMLDLGQGAIVNFRLLVDATGGVTGCFIQQTTRPKAFDDAVCKSIMKRAKFDPALDKDGKPILSYYNNTVRFMPYG